MCKIIEFPNINCGVSSFLDLLKIGDKLRISGTKDIVTVCGEYYNDGFDYMIPCKEENGNVINYSVLGVDFDNNYIAELYNKPFTQLTKEERRYLETREDYYRDEIKVAIKKFNKI